jgi:hypothetical protein
LNQFIEYYERKLDQADIKYLKRTSEVTDAYPKFYITAKIHKHPWKTRPIVSVSGSQLDGIGRWVDKIMQPYMKAATSTILSSTTLKDTLMELGQLPNNARLFTTDAVSMYTNIDTTHALHVIKGFIRKHPTYATLHEQNAVTEALELIMRKNIFQFGDTYWLQLNGTAMGVSPSCMYATLYFAVHEETLLTKYPELRLYKRYIDDVIGIWIPRTIHDDSRWQQFQKDMNNFGRLRWTFSERTQTVNFLDLTISIHDGFINTKLYDKPENLYLYLPATSAHPFGTLKGLIHGMVYRTIRLTSEIATQKIELQNLVRRLTARGYQQNFLVDIINKTYKKIHDEQASNQMPATESSPPGNNKNICFFHSYCHPNDPKSSKLKKYST